MPPEKPTAPETVNATWYKSSYTANNSNCVEVCDLPVGGRAFRDSKNRHLPPGFASSAAWGRFISAVTEGTLD